MARTTGVVSRGIRCPIIREGDDLVTIVRDSVMDAVREENIIVRDRDIVGVTEAVVARAQGNYCTCDDIAADVRAKFGDRTVGLIFPILSRNRFSLILKGIARGARKIVLMLSYPSDEVGNHLVSLDRVDEEGLNPYSDLLTEEEYRSHFGYQKHEFTGVDYVEFYRSLITAENCEAEIIFANSATRILEYTDSVICADIHTRARSKRLLKKAGASLVLGLDDLMTESINGSGFNSEYGLLGSNKATENTLKLFPRDAQAFAEKLSGALSEATGKKVEALVYGDGAFKDPQGKIWELADPVVSPGYTSGLSGLPNEVKLKYLADNDFAALKGDELKAAMKEYISHKDSDLKGQMVSQGTTPRKITDLIGSLCDLTSGSGDKGTPVIFIQGYFDTYADE
ncbi:MAG: coenzyme F420-0:L-glutamate ligase [Bullifex sp.]|nr:coenzyme F420-0:L-glutamate ligase [Bullifex sp.]